MSDRWHYRHYDYYRDPENTKLIASIFAVDLEAADAEFQSRFGENPLDVYLWIRIPKMERQ